MIFQGVGNCSSPRRNACLWLTEALLRYPGICISHERYGVRVDLSGIPGISSSPRRICNVSPMFRIWIVRVVGFFIKPSFLVHILYVLFFLDYDGQPMSAARVIQIAPVSQPCFLYCIKIIPAHVGRIMEHGGRLMTPSDGASQRL